MRSKRIAKGLYRDAYGVRAVVHAGRQKPSERHFPTGTPIAEMQTWRERERVRLLSLAPPPVRAGSLAAAVRLYLRRVKPTLDKATWKSRRSELKAWTDLFPGLPRWQFGVEQIRQAVRTWEKKKIKRTGRPASAKTIRHRCQALEHVFHVLDGRGLPTPFDELLPRELPAVKVVPKVYVPDALILTVEEGLRKQEAAGRLRSAKTRARFMVLAATGKRPAEVKAAKPTDVDLTRRVWQVRDAKGGDTPGGLYLNDDMLAAWTLFARAKAWGPFDTRSYVRVLRTAGWPPGLRPYQMRHAVGMSLSESGVDLADIQAWLGHRRIETTRKNYVPVLNSRMQKMAEKLGARFGWTPDALVDFVGRRQKRRKQA